MSEMVTAQLELVKMLLRNWQEWEAAVILDPEQWSRDYGFQVTGDHYDRYIQLQDFRLQTEAALSDTTSGGR